MGAFFNNFPFVTTAAALFWGSVLTYVFLRPRLKAEARLDNQSYIIRVVVPALAAIIIAMTIALMHGLFDPRVNNDKIMAIVGPAFQTIVGVFAGFIGGYALAKNEPKNS